VDSEFYRVAWQAAAGKRYQLEYADNQISEFSPFGGTNWPRVALARREVFEDDVSTNTPAPFLRAYRVRLIEP
jgi:hypothetical protein